MLNQKLAATVLVASLAISMSTQASAGDFRFGFHRANPVAVVAGAVIGAAVVSSILAPPVYYAPPPVAYAPGPYYAPAAAYYPAPVAYYAPGPVYYGRPAVYVGGRSRYYVGRRR